MGNTCSRSLTRFRCGRSFSPADACRFLASHLELEEMHASFLSSVLLSSFSGMILVQARRTACGLCDSPCAVTTNRIPFFLLIPRIFMSRRVELRIYGDNEAVNRLHILPLTNHIGIADTSFHTYLSSRKSNYWFFYERPQPSFVGKRNSDKK